ncbi:transmembrane protease serine 9-like [Anopheles nili]|uniref:transmembrane protease serine 9-like n=1 Tax=Anopheles nili TaxID=185578 RepID=UPI00237A8132|nr:transmembrane protease serine 9-like [Anopheles nili]
MASRTKLSLAIVCLVVGGLVPVVWAGENNCTTSAPIELTSENLTVPGRFAWNDSLMIDPNGFTGKAPLLNSGVWTWITTIFGMPVFSVFAYRAAPRNCVPCSCGTNSNNSKIVGGHEAEIGRYPWMVALYYNNRFICGGSLINDRYVLTAAHCVFGSDRSRFRVKFLMHDRTVPKEDSFERKVSYIMTNWFLNVLFFITNDVALLKLSEPVPLGETIIPVCLPPEGNTYAGKEGVVTGWGKRGDGSFPMRLQEVRVPILDNEQCHNQTQYYRFQINDRMMCAGIPEGGKDSCQGDSGGPMHVFDADANRFVIAGVVSWGFGCAQPRFPGIYARVNRFISWINFNTRDALCGVGGRTNRIVGGTETTAHQFPWLAGLFRQGKLYCGASVVSRNFLVTAAHCVNSFEPSEIRVYLGGHNIAKDYTELRRVKRIIDHEDFDIFTFNNDIALLELDKPLRYGPTIQPACLPDGSVMDFTGTLGVVAGWGRIEEKRPPSKTLRSVEVPIWSHEQCLEAGYGSKKISPNMMCAGYHDGQKDACQGDSGGPMHKMGLFGSMEVIGVVSWGRGCARPNLPGIYTRLVNYLPWIHEKLAQELALVLLLGSVAKVDGQQPWNDTELIGRHGRFLFDTLFGLNTAAFSLDDDDDLTNNQVKSCDCECGAANQEIRIVGGRPTGVNQYPWLARLVYDGQFHCGASLLTRDYVLTAAHCVRRLKRNKIRVILGDYDQFIASETPAIMRAVTAIIRHRSFDQNSYNHDIALLKLRKPVEFTKTIRPVCLPKERSEPAGQLGTVVGWGRTSEGGTLPALVQHVDVPILTLDQCRSMKYRASRITSNMLCAGKGKQDSCQGDSGGPLLVRNGDKHEIVGIVSWGVGCGRAGYPGVYTRVARYLPWLRANLDDTCLCSKTGMEVSNLARSIMNLRINVSMFGSVFIALLLVGLLPDEATGKLLAQGKYEMLATPNKNTDERSIVDNMKMLFGGGSNRAPIHDTPASACSCRCGERNDASRIVGGQATGVNEFPWMARLSYFNRFYCGGMLINDRYVLTAAHCVKGFMWFMIKVTFGEHNRCDDSVRPETRFVLRAIAQKFSFLNFDNDIALLRLNDRVPITDFIRPICLPSDPDNAYVGTNGTATGWGTLKEDGKPSCVLQEVEVPVLSNEVCSTQTNYTASMITDNMLCAGYLGVGEKDSCQGDSGGPLIAEREDKRYELIGVVSWGNGCARPYYPGVYTRVTRYLDWIRENSKDGCFCSE